jgi:catechol 2,3-dioxygenase-like lactoylglutathione lyase family enzyme
MNMKLELLILPVSDVDRAKAFYEKLGFRLDIDVGADDYRVIQFTPPGSDASIIFGKGVTCAQPGSIDRLLMTVPDINAARRELISSGVEVSDVFHDPDGGLGGGFHASTAVRAAGPDPARRSYGSYASFEDPDGNHWVLQEVTTRLPGRVAGHTTYASAGELSEALQRAAAAHGQHETRTGQADAQWPTWYAQYMRAEQAGTELPT